MGFLSRFVRREDDPVVKVARAFIEDRPWPGLGSSSAEIRLVIALYESLPEYFDVKERCGCGERSDCDECPTRKDLRRRVNGLREELVRRRMASITPAILENRHVDR